MMENKDNYILIKLKLSHCGYYIRRNTLKKFLNKIFLFNSSFLCIFESID